MSQTLLIHSLEVFEQYLIPGVSEIMINKPGELWVDDSGVLKQYFDDALTVDVIKAISINIAGSAGQELSHTKPLVSTTLPNYEVNGIIKGGERVQIVNSPLVPINQMALAIRIPSTKKFTIDDYKKQGAFEQIGKNVNTFKLVEYYKNKQWYDFIIEAVKSKLNIVNSGGTSTGKTTFLNTLVSLIPLTERIITIEDSLEIKAAHKNQINLVTSNEIRNSNNEIISPAVTTRELIAASLRLRPDRIITGELRGSEAFDFLRAANSGHPGSFTTIHSDTASGALEVLKQLVMQAGMSWSGVEIMSYIKSVVDVVIQWERIGDRRVVSEIWWKDAP